MLGAKDAEAAEKRIKRIKKIQEELKAELVFVQQRITRYVNLKRIKGLILKEGDKAYLIRRNIKIIRPNSKLNYKKLGLFKILRQISLVNYELALPYGIRIHLIFYISLLELVAKEI